VNARIEDELQQQQPGILKRVFPCHLQHSPGKKWDVSRESRMTATICLEEIVRNVEANPRCQLTELVRGSDRSFLDQMTPLVSRQSLSLDINSVERIDAAGIAALISLYRISSEAGYRFSITNPTPHVNELLALVGLDNILLSHNAKYSSHSGSRMAQDAA
jgi:anti-anti-sigma regulatory factor